MNLWINLTPGTQSDNPRDSVQSLSHNLEVTEHLLNCLPSPRPFGEAKLDQIYLVFEVRGGEGELEISPVEVDYPRTKMFTASFDWLRAEFLDPISGPWLILSHVALILHGLYLQGATPLPIIPVYPDLD